MPGRVNRTWRRVRPVSRLLGMGSLMLLLSLPVVTGCGKGDQQGAGATGRGGAAGKSAPGGRGGSGGRSAFVMPPTPVEVAAATAGPVADRFETVGTFEAGEEITVVSEIDGTVIELPFIEGAAIRKGGIIARIDDLQLRAEASRAEAQRDQQRSNHERVRSVVEQGAGAPQDLDDAAAALKVAEANLEVARARLAKTRITAPFEGVTGARRVSPGAFLRTGQAVTSLARLRDLRVNFSAPERVLPLLVRGSAVRVSTSAWPGYEETGSVTVVEPVLDPVTRTAGVVARVPNPQERFRPGMSAGIVITLGAGREALTVPAEAVFSEGDRAFVYLVKPDSTVARTPVRLGVRLSDAVEVIEGITAGAIVVRAGHQKLYEGAKVAPIRESRTGPDGAGGTGRTGGPDGAGGSAGGGGSAGTGESGETATTGKGSR
jgi:membrane fusion protein, multidrug efflux system